ncbi:hypothetical protein ACIQ2D_21365 [Lysinibacillus sp. NPDC097287]|uniref:hypothetical protein n=1 Tax=Lysinibacillus sp. NPDC097287 TaxID=3364144 RepID=UPI003815B55A
MIASEDTLEELKESMIELFKAMIDRSHGGNFPDLESYEVGELLQGVDVIWIIYEVEESPDSSNSTEEN